MNRTTYFALSIMAFSLSLLGCQSDAQKMTNGLAQEYQRRYTNCNDSVQPFTRYAGFGFVEDSGVCQCNEKLCKGNEQCGRSGQCKPIIPECAVTNSEECNGNEYHPAYGTECKPNEKICISPTLGQICIDSHWSDPTQCTDETVCNADLQGEHVCAPRCSKNICYNNEDGKALFYECDNGNYKDAQESDVSCMSNTERGKCKNGDLRFDNGLEICENGIWVNSSEHTTCFNRLIDGGSEIIIPTNDTNKQIKLECEHNCNNNRIGCAENVLKSCNPGDTKCDNNALEICNSSGQYWDVTICEKGCDQEKKQCHPE